MLLRSAKYPLKMVIATYLTQATLGISHPTVLTYGTLMSSWTSDIRDNRRRMYVIPSGVEFDPFVA